MCDKYNNNANPHPPRKLNRRHGKERHHDRGQWCSPGLGQLIQFPTPANEKGREKSGDRRYVKLSEPGRSIPSLYLQGLV